MIETNTIENHQIQINRRWATKNHKKNSHDSYNFDTYQRNEKEACRPKLLYSLSPQDADRQGKFNII